VDGDRIVTLAPKGELVAVERTTGRLLWARHLPRQFGGQIPKWGYSASPLVAEGRVYVDVGGHDGHGVVAFSRDDGRVLWRTGTYKAGYSSPVQLTLAGTPQIVFFTGKGVVSTRPSDGHVLWEAPWQISYDVSAATPVHVPPSAVFIAAGYAVGGTLYDVAGRGAKLKAAARWQTRRMRNKMATSILIGDHLYGFDEERLTALSAATGKVVWQKESFGRGSLIAAGDQLIVLGEDCRLVLVRASPKGYSPLASPAKVFDTDRCWTVPALANGVLYVRDLKTMKALTMAAR
jgi:outer membrane protein assembly factor BamB